MDRKNFLKLFTAAGVTLITLNAISCHNESKRNYVVNTKKCNGCEKCIKRCGHKAIILKNEKAFIDMKLCKHCGNCQEHCKRDAIMSFKRSDA